MNLEGGGKGLAKNAALDERALGNHSQFEYAVWNNPQRFNDESRISLR
jgi:hypothetical protein